MFYLSGRVCPSIARNTFFMWVVLFLLGDVDEEPSFYLDYLVLFIPQCKPARMTVRVPIHLLCQSSNYHLSTSLREVLGD